MNIIVSTDRNTQGSAILNEHVNDVLTVALERFSGQITRVEVHLGDENGEKVGVGHDKKCLLEARIANVKPIVVSHKEDSIHQAIDGATDKLVRAIDTCLGKLTDHTKPVDLFDQSSGDSEVDELQESQVTQ